MTALTIWLVPTKNAVIHAIVRQELNATSATIVRPADVHQDTLVIHIRHAVYHKSNMNNHNVLWMLIVLAKWLALAEFARILALKQNLAELMLSVRLLIHCL